MIYSIQCSGQMCNRILYFVHTFATAIDLKTKLLCDYIMGPASTFSWWAAYYGDKPRLSLRSRDETVSLDKFVKETALISQFGHRK